MQWLRTQKCVASGAPAECAHHIRLGTNGGKGLKPSDYFCIPLENDYHTHGPYAVHRMGEQSFLEKFKLNREELFIHFLTLYLKQSYEIVLELDGLGDIEKIAKLIEEIENRRPAKKVTKHGGAKKSKKSKVQPNLVVPKASETEYYQKAKELKRQRDKELRDQLSAQKPKQKTASLKDNPFYQKAKELKREQDQKLRKELKKKSQSVAAPKNIDHYEKLKEEQKIKAREYRRAQYQKLKQLKSEQK